MFTDKEKDLVEIFGQFTQLIIVVLKKRQSIYAIELLKKMHLNYPKVRQKVFDKELFDAFYKDRLLILQKESADLHDGMFNDQLLNQLNSLNV